MRRRYAEGKLTTDQHIYLQRINFDFERDPGFVRWYAQYKEFARYWNSIRVEKGVRITADQMPLRLRKWISHEREKRDRGMLLAKRRALLEQLDIDWAPYDHSWDRGFRLVTEHLQEHGRIVIGDDDDSDVARWIKSIRRRISEDRVPEERIDQLNALGVTLTPLRSRRLHVLDVVREFRDRHGHAAIPERSGDESVDALMAWARGAYRVRTLDAGLIAELDELGFVWNIRQDPNFMKMSKDRRRQAMKEDHWVHLLGELNAFIAEHGRLPRHKDASPGKELWHRVRRIISISRNPTHKLYQFYAGEPNRILREQGWRMYGDR
ncbi:MAG: hypothetical protein EHM43_10365 [Ignavibacteriae bacterium]|nr:MAG: hypothetical protein EHM43_10365 [Ignavibacteriota bacterium]